MIKKTAAKRLLPLATALALTAITGLSHAQSTIVLSNDSSKSPAFYDGNPGGSAAYTWQATGGPNGGGCIVGTINEVTNHEFDPAFNVSFPSSQYYQVSVQMKVDPASGTTGFSGSGGFGSIQLAFLDAGTSWSGVGYHTIYPPAATEWVTYVFSVPDSALNMAHLQLQLQASGDYSAPVTIYIGDVTIAPNPNPLVLEAFSNNATAAGGWDSEMDAPYRNPVAGGAPTTLNPQGSWSLYISNPGAYSGWNQISPVSALDTTKYQYVGFDVYLDGSDGATYGGAQLLFFKNNWSGLTTIGALSFDASMVGKWTHFDFPCSISGITASPALVFQGTPGDDGGANNTTFHIDNLQVWNPVIRPSITSVLKSTLGGVQITLDGGGLSNTNDQEGITSPSTNNLNTDYFWINQTPATYAFTVTNFPSPDVGPQFDAHIYLCNGDSIAAFNNQFDYNQTYSGVPYNMVDYLGLHVQNGSNGGVIAIVDWKTNAPNANASNSITFNFNSMTNANGTWRLTFSDNTHGSVIAADGSINNFTLPDFLSDPNYSGNFTPGSSMFQFGIFKNGNTNNNDKSLTLTRVGVTNSTTTLTDNFSGPGLAANNNWLAAEFYLDGANRAIWQPHGTAYWLKWNSASSGWGVQSSSNAVDWVSTGTTYTYVDGTGTNTLGAVPANNLPAGKSGFFRLVK